MNEEVLLRLGFDASAVKRGTMAMMDQQKKAASDYVSFWKKAVSEREQVEIAADVRAASRSNQARAIWRQRQNERMEATRREIAEREALETAADVRAASRSNKARGILRERRSSRVGAWRAGLAAQRVFTPGEAKNSTGVALENLARNVGSGGGGGGHGGGMNSTAMREMATIAREASRGNWSRIPGSLSILIQSFGKLGSVLSALVSPVTGAVAGLAAGVGAVYKIGYNATQTIRQAGDAGFSTSGYQTLLRQAGRESGGAEAAQSAMGTLSQNLGELRSGDMGQMRKFRKYGIATTTANGGALSNEQVFSNILAKYESTGDPAKRAAMAMDMFGESYKKFVKTLNEGQGGFNAAMGKGVQSAGQLSVWSQLGSNIGDVTSGAWNGIKRAGGSVWNAMKSGYVGYATSVNSGLAGIERETARGEELDKKEKALMAAGKIKPIRMTQKQFETEHPDLAADFKGAGMRVEDLQNELADRGKMGMSELSDAGRRLTGHIRPRQYTVTARMRTAMKIDDLDAASTRAWERGDDAGMQKLRAEADAMRKANPWLKAGDRDPTRKIDEQLIIANKALADIQAMAQMVMSGK